MLSFTRTIRIFEGFYLFIFRERRREGEGEGEKHQSVVAPHGLPPGGLARNPGMCPKNQAGDPLVCRPLLNPLSHTSQGRMCFLKKKVFNVCFSPAVH